MVISVWLSFWGGNLGQVHFDLTGKKRGGRFCLKQDINRISS